MNEQNPARPVAFITGASQGIGAATAIEFARRGYHVAILARNEPALQKVADEARQHGAEALVFAGDVGDLEFGQKCVEATVARWHRVDVLVNNAAWHEVVTMRRISPESWRRTLEVCLTAPAFLARWCAAQMEEQGIGVIINISSINALQAAGLSPACAAAKGGLDALSFELAALYGPRGVRVLSLDMGAVDTAMSGDYEGDAEGEDITRDLHQFAEEMISLRRFATPEEAARTIALFASPDASYISGTNIVTHGGWVHQHLPFSLKQRQFPQEFK